jgi:hypothetical protein
MGGRAGGRMGGQAGRQTDKRMDGRTDRQTVFLALLLAQGSGSVVATRNLHLLAGLNREEARCLAKWRAAQARASRTDDDEEPEDEEPQTRWADRLIH